MAKIAIVDPDLTMTLPANITAATGIDALTHHIEAFLAKGVHPMCDGIACEGMRLIQKNLLAAVHSPNRENRAGMMIAATTGAVAFQKGLGVVHSCAHALSTLFDLHHGLANAIMLPHGLAFNANGQEARYETMAQAFGLVDTSPEAVIDFICMLNKKSGLPAKLSTVGVSKEDMGRLAELAVQDGCHQCNPKPVCHEDFLQIFQEAL